MRRWASAVAIFALLSSGSTYAAGMTGSAPAGSVTQGKVIPSAVLAPLKPGGAAGLRVASTLARDVAIGTGVTGGVLCLILCRGGGGTTTKTTGPRGH